MKVTKILWCLFLTGISIGTYSCSEKMVDQQQEKAVNFIVTSDRMQTKASATAFAIGDAIGIYAVKRKTEDTPANPTASGNYAHNVKWVNTENGWRPADVKDVIVYPEDGTRLDFYAYYPYCDYKGDDEGNNDPRNFWFELQGDQNEGDNFTFSDFMAASNQNGNTQGEVELKFEHKLSLLEMELEAENGIDLQDLSEVYVSDVISCFYMNFYTNEMELWEDEDRIKPLYMKQIQDIDGKLVFQVLLPSQTIAQGKTLFNYVVGDIKYVYKSDELELLPGTKTRFKIKLQ